MIYSKIEEIADLVRKGGVIAYPTEAVFGLGCDPDNEDAIQRILYLKQRAIEKGLIVITSQLTFVEKYLLPITQEDKDLLNTVTDQPISWLVPAKTTTSPFLRGTFSSLAIRKTTHPACYNLCEALQHALVSTSANPQGASPATSVEEVEHYFGNDLDGILDAPLGDADKPSQLIDLHSKRILRS